MDRSAMETIGAVVRSASSPLVVAGDVVHRAAAAAAAGDGHDPVVEVPAPEVPAPWSGVGAVIDACRAARPRVAVPAALEAAATGRPVGDHLGLGADLSTLLAGLGEDGACTLVVHDAHRFDLSSAAALSHALSTAPADVRAVVTQDRTGRGVVGLPVHVVSGGVASAPVDPVPPEPASIDDAVRRARDAARLGAVLDAAATAESAGLWAMAARYWFDGARPGRCRRALALAGPDPEAAEVSARLAMRTESGRLRRVAVAQALSVLDGPHPIAAVRLRLLEASARTDQDGAGDAAALLAEAVTVLATAEPTPGARVAQELHALVTRTSELARCGDAGPLLDGLERPLARLGAGAVDPDAVELVTAAAQVLGWHHHLDDARAVLDRVVGLLDARRHVTLLGRPLAASAWLARRRGRLELALTHGTRAIEISSTCGWTNEQRLATVEMAHVEALHGRLEDCRRHVATLVRPGEAPRGAAQLGAVSALAVAELLADAPDRAAELLEPVQARFGRSISPAQTAWRHNLVEAYVRTGRVHEAGPVFDELVSWAARTGSAREQGQVAWCRGMLAPAGQHDEHFAEAGRLLAAFPTLRWRAELHHVRRLLAEGRRDEAAGIAAELATEATGQGLHALVDRLRALLQAYDVPALPEPGPTTASLGVDDLRVALALAEGADVEEVAALLRLTPRHVEEARERVLLLLGVDGTEHLAGFLAPDRATPGRTAARVRLLGPPAVHRGAQQLVPPPGRPAALLALVALHRSVPIERVLDVLWPDVEPARSRSRLRNVLARLRAGVGAVVDRDGERLVLAADVEVDVHRFDRMADDALRAPDPEVLAATEAALAAWTGEPLPAWPYEDWALRERHRLVRRCVALHVRRADVLVTRGAIGAALDELELALDLEPEDGELWERAVALAEGDERVGRARALRRRAGDHEIDLV